MKITQVQLKRIIKEEINEILGLLGGPEGIETRVRKAKETSQDTTDFLYRVYKMAVPVNQDLYHYVNSAVVHLQEDGIGTNQLRKIKKREGGEFAEFVDLVMRSVRNVALQDRYKTY